jgi:hypothetical protein
MKSPAGMTNRLLLFYNWCDEGEKMKKRSEGSNIGMKGDDLVGIRVLKKAIRSVDNHNQRFHRLERFSEEFYDKAGAVVHGPSCVEPKDCPGGVCHL